MSTPSGSGEPQRWDPAPGWEPEREPAGASTPAAGGVSGTPSPGFPPAPPPEAAGYGPTPGYGQVPAYGQYGYAAPGYGHPMSPSAYRAPWVSPVPFGTLASFGKRAGAYLIDMAVIAAPLFVAYIVFMVSAFTATDASGRPTEEPSVGATIFFLVAFLWYLAAWVWTRVVQQGRTGQSVGKRAMGIRLVGVSTGRPVGPGMALGRDLAHYVDGAIYIGYLWPLWDDLSQTLADKICSTVVIDA